MTLKNFLLLFIKTYFFRHGVVRHKVLVPSQKVNVGMFKSREKSSRFFLFLEGLSQLLLSALYIKNQTELFQTIWDLKSQSFKYFKVLQHI